MIHIERQHVPFLICLVTRVREKIDSRTPSIPNLCDDYNCKLQIISWMEMEKYYEFQLILLSLETRIESRAI